MGRRHEAWRLRVLSDEVVPDTGIVRTPRGGELQDSAAIEQLLATRGFEVLPEGIGAQDEGHVVGAFGIGVADDAGVTTMTAVAVDVGELLEGEGRDAPLAEGPGGGGAHGAAANDDDRIAPHGCSPFPWGDRQGRRGSPRRSADGSVPRAAAAQRWIMVHPRLASESPMRRR